MATQRLYYEDAFLREFTARVVDAAQLEDGRWGIILDRTAFYPEGGGQPADAGWLGDCAVLDVRTKGDDVLHICDRKPEAEEVTGRLDWERRFDHMQQHSGEHVLSGAFLELFQAENIGFHLGPDSVYIDVTLDPMTPEQAAAVEARANAAVWANIPVSAQIVENDEKDRFPLRKLPAKAFSSLRVVDIPGIDCCPCGGTHVSFTGQIGLIKIRSWERKSGATRVEFVSGGRALADYELVSSTVRRLSTRLSTPVAAVGEAVEKQLTRLEGQHKELQTLRLELGGRLAAELYAGSEEFKGAKLIVKAFDAPPPLDLADYGRLLLNYGPAIVLFGYANAEEGKTQLIFGCSPDLGLNMGALLKATLPAIGGKGGGSPLWAQGGGPFADNLEEALSGAKNGLLGA